MKLRRVLVVDDQADQRDALEALLRLEVDVTTVAAESAAAALELLRTDLSLDLVISDYVMPGMDGLRFAAEARRLRPNLRVILMTGHDEVIDRVLDAGVIAMLKPASAAAFKTVLSESLRSP